MLAQQKYGMKISSQQFAVFSMVGITSAIMDVGLLLALVQMGANASIALTAAFFFGLGINFWLHARLTFQTQFSAKNAVRFLMLAGMNYGLTLGIVFICEHVGLSYLIGKIISLPLVAVHGFLWSSVWVFKS